MTTQPAAAALGAYTRDTSPPGENSPISVLLKSKALELLDGDGAALEFDPLAQGAVAGQGMDLGHREIALFQHLEQGFADQAGGADDRNGEFDLRTWLLTGVALLMSGVDDFTSAFCARWRK